MPGLGPFLNNEIIQGMAYLSSTLDSLKNSSIIAKEIYAFSFKWNWGLPVLISQYIT